MTILHNIGDAATIMGKDVILARSEIVEGIRYDLYNDAKLRDHGGAIRVFDTDSENVVTIKSYNDYNMAVSEFKDAVKNR